MSVQFGRWNYDGQPMERDYLEKAAKMLAPYGPDAEGTNIKDTVGILFHAFHTTRESRRESQPHVTPSGAVLSWDGRLDNRTELTGQLREDLKCESTDVAIVAAAYEEWGTGCFAKLIGDWALSVWNPVNRSLILAKDPIGTRHLYYAFDKNQVTWSTILDPLVLLAGKTFALEEEYIAGWLSFFPATHLTPYIGIHSVPPSCFVRLEPGKQTTTRYWDFDPSKRIRYRTDGEYEEHFRQVFAEAVRRRLRSDSPILAELSGGMDSSSIVCVADSILERRAAETPRLDTVSYYDDSEPNWNERPYFTKVEEKRGRTGCHIDVGSRVQGENGAGRELFSATPGAGVRGDERLNACMTSRGNRVLLSGIGGDEVTGGVPTPTSELEDLLARAKFRTLAHQLKVWALNKRKPWFHLLFDAARGFFSPGVFGVPKFKRPAPWLNATFVRSNRAAFLGYERRVRLFGPLPTFLENLNTLHGLQRQLGCAALPFEPHYEKRFPYLDRDLLEFIYASPREQLVRPGQRRSLMRRALVGLLPSELLNRKRKAYIARGPMTDISSGWARFADLSQHMLSSTLGIVDVEKFLEALQKARHGEEVAVVILLRTLSVENWLHQLKVAELLNVKVPPAGDRSWDREGTPLPLEVGSSGQVDTAPDDWGEAPVLRARRNSTWKS